MAPVNPYQSPVSRCPRCGADLVPGSGICSHCGSRSGPAPGQDTVLFKRTPAITVLAILNFIAAGLGLVPALIIVTVALMEPDSTPIAIFAGALSVVGVGHIFCGLGLWKLKAYGRRLQILFAAVGLLGIPFGTIVSVVVLVYLLKPGVKTLFSEKPRNQLTAQEIGEVNALHQSSATTVVVLAIAAPILGVFLIGVIAAIAIPSLLRAKVSANEAQAIGDIRTMISAETAYSTSNGGYYDQLDCLADPVRCIPNYPDTGAPFLWETMTEVKSGYERTFHPGPPVPPDEIASAHASPTSIRSFAYVAIPVDQGITGVRGFCGDSTGRICTTEDGSAPKLVDGGCDPACSPLQ